MKKTIFLLLVLITACQLSGGYALAATLISPAKSTTAPVGATKVSEKKTDVFHLLNQLLSQEEEEKESLNYFPNLLGVCPTLYTFLPVFSVQNKHFLIHYAAAIKGKLPTRYLLLQIFRL